MRTEGHDQVQDDLAAGSPQIRSSRQSTRREKRGSSLTAQSPVDEEEVAELLGRVGRPMEPPARLRRMVFGLAARSPAARPGRRLRSGLVAAAGLLLALGLVGTAVYAVSQATAFQAIRAVELHGILGARAVARLGAPNGPNRPVQLIVQHLEPGAQHSFDLWLLNEQPRTVLATFMTSKEGGCIIIFSAPSNLDLRDLVITPRQQTQEFVLCSDQARC